MYSRCLSLSLTPTGYRVVLRAPHLDIMYRTSYVTQGFTRSVVVVVVVVVFVVVTP
jgi:hypothetical protein